MMYLLEVYLLEKKNYYDSYHELIQFLSQDNLLSLYVMFFLMDLLCLKESEQKQVVSHYFGPGMSQTVGFCPKDAFYRVCVKF